MTECGAVAYDSGSGITHRCRLVVHDEGNHKCDGCDAEWSTPEPADLTMLVGEWDDGGKG